MVGEIRKKVEVVVWIARNLALSNTSPAFVLDETNIGPI